MARKARKKSAAKAKKKPTAVSKEKAQDRGEKEVQGRGKKEDGPQDQALSLSPKASSRTIVADIKAVVDTLTDAERLHRKLEPHGSRESE